MNHVKYCFFSILFFLCSAYSQTADSLHGIVLDETSAPVAGASVQLGLLSTTTDSNGVFILDGDVPVRFLPKTQDREVLSIQGNILKVNLVSPKEIGVTLFDFAGRKVKTIRPALMQPGLQCIPLVPARGAGLSQAAYIAVVRCGIQSFSFRWIRAMGSSGSQSVINAGAAAAKRKSAVLPSDTIFISKTGFVSRKVFIASLFSDIAPITLYNETSLRKVFLRAPFLPGAQVVNASVVMPENSDTLTYGLFSNMSNNYSATVNVLKHVFSQVQINFLDTLGNLGVIKTSIDTMQDTLEIDARRIFIQGAFAPGEMGSVAVCSWKDSANDTFNFPLAWSALIKGKYSGTILAPMHGAIRALVTVSKTDTGITRRLGATTSALDSARDSATINCTSSLPILFVGSDTVLGWGDTMRLHFTAMDSVDSIVQYSWQFSGSGLNTSDAAPTTFVIVPMFNDSIFKCTVSATDANGNTSSDTIQALMTCSVKNFRVVDDEVANWNQTGNFSVFGKDRIAAAIDPATPYFNTIAEAAKQSMQQIDQRSLTAVIADLATSENASLLFNAKKSSINPAALKTSTAYADSIVVIDNSPSDGIIVYARFKSFFFQLSFSGFLTYDMAVLNAEKFISVYEQRAIKTSICRDK